MRQPLLFLIAAGSALAQQPIGSGTIQSETRLVLVDTTVLDKKGNPVRGLAQGDFKVFEDGKEQPITAFSAESGDAPDTSRKRYLVLFFDDSVPSAGQTFVRQAATKFIDANVAPNRLMAIAEYNGSLVMTQNFTTDADLLKKAVVNNRFSGSRNVTTTGVGAAAQTSYSVRSALGALRSLAKGLSATPGRKTIVFVSAGYPATQDAIDEINATIVECNRDNVALFPIAAALGEVGGNSFDADSGAAAAPARGRTNPRTTAAAEATTPATMQQSLFTLANGTGGYVIANTNDVLGGMEKIGKEQEDYYLLGYTPAKDAAPGVCHNLKVKVDRPGITVRARPSYCEAVSLDVLAGTPAERDLENRMNANASPTVSGAALATPFFYTAKNTARVHALLEIPPGTFEFTKDKGKLRSGMNVVGIAWLPDGTVKARFSDSIKVAFDDKKQVDAFNSKTFEYEKQFPIGPGQYSFKIVFSSGAKQFGKMETTLTVEPWDPGVFAISGLALSKTARPARPKVEGLDPSLVDDRVPLVSGNAEIPPMASNHLSKSGKNFVYAELYEPALAVAGLTDKDAPAVGVQMEILDSKTGATVKDFGLMRLPLPALTGNPAVPMGLVVTAPELPPGPYKLRITALDDKKRQAARTIDIQLEN
jgi:VWFA-related protein